MSARRRVIHIINSFEFGGAEAMLCNLVLRTDAGRFDCSIVSLMDDLTVAGPILSAGIPLLTMGMRPGVPDPRAAARLARHLRRARPDIVQTWMDHSNLIGGLAARFAGARHVVWGIHHAEHVRGVAKRSTQCVVSACAVLSAHVPSRIVCCSEQAAHLYARRGFDATRMMVIPNGFDTRRFQPDQTAREAIRREISVEQTAPLVGVVARYDPCKDHATFLQSARLLADRSPSVKFLLCGHKVDSSNAELISQVRAAGLDSRCRLLGPRQDIPRIYAALDVLCSSSISEAFPLAVGEAMACGIPCVVTDVGDSSLMVGPTGAVVPARDPQGLAAQIGRLLALPPGDRVELGLAARERVRRMFDLGAVTRRYEQVYDALTAGAPARLTARWESDPRIVPGH